MKKFLLCTLTVVLIVVFAMTAAAAVKSPGRVDVSLNFKRMVGFASNQFAVWIEDSNGKYLKTVYATRWTADGGWEPRPLSLAMWVESSNLPDMDLDKVDAFSSATPSPGEQTYTWDCTDDNGKVVSNGVYFVKVEGTLRNENVSIFTAKVTVGGPDSEAQIETEFLGDETKDRDMLTDVRVTYKKL